MLHVALYKHATHVAAWCSSISDAIPPVLHPHRPPMLPCTSMSPVLITLLNFWCQLRFFRGNHQGHLCTGLQNVKLHRCHLQPAAISEVVSVTANREVSPLTPSCPPKPPLSCMRCLQACSLEKCMSRAFVYVDVLIPKATRGTEGLPGFEMANPSYYLN